MRCYWPHCFPLLRYSPALVVQLMLSPRQTAAASADDVKSQRANPNHETYRSYFFDLREIAERQDFAVIVDELRHQIDIVEGVGLSQRVLKFFHTVPIVADELASLSSPKDHPDALAAACYVGWAHPDAVDVAADTGRGVVMVRPIRIDAQRPLVLHELLHAYHANILPQGFKNPAVLFHYDLAKSKDLYPAAAYLLTNEKEFFAVTASVFLYGKDGTEPFTRSNLKQRQPDYFNYLVWLFGFDPDRGPGSAPIASAD